MRVPFGSQSGQWIPVKGLGIRIRCQGFRVRDLESGVRRQWIPAAVEGALGTM